MPKIIQLSTHIANLIAAGEVVERPASVVKELLENAVDAGASKVTVEIRDGGMTFLRVTDNGCGMAPEDAKTAFLRHATSKLRTAEDLAAIGTMGFRGEALAAIASVSRIDLLTKTAGAISGISLRLEAGVITEQSEAGCPEGTTIIVRDLFYNTPARMKFMKSDTVEGSRITATVQTQALAHPEVAFQLIRDSKTILSTPGNGGLQAAVYCVYGRECAKMIPVESRWEQYSLSGYVSKPTDSRPSRNLQTFFVNDRPVKSKILVSALEEAYRNQIMVGKFPACVLHLTLPAGAVDVNVHPAKTEIKFLNEKTAFDCVHYGVLAALNRTPDRPQVQFKSSTIAKQKESVIANQSASSSVIANQSADWCGNLQDRGNHPGDCHVGLWPPRNDSGNGCGNPQDRSNHPGDCHVGPWPPRNDNGNRNDGGHGKQSEFFRTMTPEEYKTFAAALSDAPQPKKEAAAATVARLERPANMPLREFVNLPRVQNATVIANPMNPVIANQSADWCDNPQDRSNHPGDCHVGLWPPRNDSGNGCGNPQDRSNHPGDCHVGSWPPRSDSSHDGGNENDVMEQTALEMPREIPWRYVGELYHTYILVEQGEEAFLIDKHAAHERILFEKLKANQEAISSQSLLQPIPVKLGAAAVGALLENRTLLGELGFEIDEFGENTLLLRQIPMDLSPSQAAETVESLSADLLSGKKDSPDTVRDELLHTVACKAAIKAGWVNDEAELLAVASAVMGDESLKYCPHGRPICVTLSKKQLEKQFRRT